MYKLMVKTHNVTGLKYLCMTQQLNYEKYNGSGKLWLKHLKKYGEDVNTEILFETTDHEELKTKGIYYSNLWDIVNSSEWANLRPEEGTGGDTVSNKFWITNGTNDRYILIGSEIPLGWKKGRSTGGFKDKAIQKELSIRAKNSENYLKAMKDPATGKKISNAKKGKPNLLMRGDNNPSKKPEVREKISNSAKNRPMLTCTVCGKIGQASPGMYGFHFEKCKFNVNDKNN
jgi:hypothetical protein